MQAIIALGANLGDPIATVKQAAKEIGALAQVTALRLSSLYRTKPVGYTEQDDFINAVMLVETSLAPADLFAHLARLEQEHHRVRQCKNGPRTLDLDLIAYGDLQSANPQLTLPHPRAQERAFVLVPLNEIAPDYVFPDSSRSVSEALALLPPNDLADVLKLD